MALLVTSLTVVNLVLLALSVHLIVRSRQRLRDMAREQERAQEVLYEASVGYGQVIALYPESQRERHALAIRAVPE